MNKETENLVIIMIGEIEKANFIRLNELTDIIIKYDLPVASFENAYRKKFDLCNENEQMLSVIDNCLKLQMRTDFITEMQTIVEEKIHKDFVIINY